MRRFRGIITILASFIVAAATLYASPLADAGTPTGPTTLTKCQALVAGTNHRSLDNRNYSLTVFSNQADIGEVETTQGVNGPDGNYFGTWFVDDRTGKYSSDHDATIFSLYCNGDLVLKRSNGIVLWHSNTAGKGVTTATLNGVGNLVLRTASGAMVWQSTSGRAAIPAGTTLPSGSALVSAWGSAWGEPWATFRMQTDGNLVWRDGSKVLWQTNTHVAGSRLVFTLAAQLQVVSPAGKVLWSSPGTGSSYSTFDIISAMDFQWEPTSKIVWGCGHDVHRQWHCGKGDIW